jgi:hypothetical protein
MSTGWGQINETGFKDSRIRGFKGSSDEKIQDAVQDAGCKIQDT